MPPRFDLKSEWIETDGLGGFASGTVSGIRTRRYQALLLAATTPPTGRFVLVNGLESWVETPAGRFALSSHLYEPDVVHPDGAQRIEEFEPDPWPRWVFHLEDGTRIEQQVLARHGSPLVALSWRVLSRLPRQNSIALSVRPLISGRDYHSLHHENPAFRFDADVREALVTWRPYPGLPRIVALSNGAYEHGPDWYRRFLYEEERQRGLDFLEDLASPGLFRWDLSHREAVWILAAEAGKVTAGGDAATGASTLFPRATTAEEVIKQVRAVESRRRKRFSTRLHRSADAYIVSRGEGRTIIAGYPWFTDWGRDTFVSLRGLCLAAGRLEEAREIFIEWAGAISEGMLPNRFPDRREEPEYNSVDASLWYVIAVHDFLEATASSRKRLPRRDSERLRVAVEAILEGYSRGTRYGIRLDHDGLLAAGTPGVQLTWMDAKVGDRVVTPRIGKPVEVQALWLNALKAGSRFSKRWEEPFQIGLQAFQSRFWNEPGGFLFDIVDVDHTAGAVDAAFRPNQIFAIGGLPFPVLEGERARRVVEAVEARLLIPIGLRSLAPGEPGYVGHYGGGPLQRDSAYHQGMAWPWLIGPFVEAWVRVHGSTAEVRRDARERFVAPLYRHLDEAGLGHISEIVDAEPPFTPRGCPFQAWSLGEILRLEHSVLAE